MVRGCADPEQFIESLQRHIVRISKNAYFHGECFPFTQHVLQLTAYHGTSVDMAEVPDHLRAGLDPETHEQKSYVTTWDAAVRDWTSPVQDASARAHRKALNCLDMDAHYQPQNEDEI